MQATQAQSATEQPPFPVGKIYTSIDSAEAEWLSLLVKPNAPVAIRATGEETSQSRHDVARLARIAGGLARPDTQPSRCRPHCPVTELDVPMAGTLVLLSPRETVGDSVVTLRFGIYSRTGEGARRTRNFTVELGRRGNHWLVLSAGGPFINSSPLPRSP